MEEALATDIPKLMHLYAEENAAIPASVPDNNPFADTAVAGAGADMTISDEERKKLLKQFQALNPGM